MTIKYSIQPSSLSPNGQSEPYGRYQVQIQDETTMPLDSTSATIAAALKAGNQVILLGSDNEPIGSILPALKGGFTLAESPTPTAENMSIGFRPSYSLHNAVQQDVEFERIDTVIRVPSIILVSDWYQNERTDGAISVNGGHSNYVEIKGNNFKLSDTLTVTLTEIGGGLLSVELADDTGLIKWTDHLIAFNTKVNIVTPETTGTLTINIGGKIATMTVSIIDRT
jgi:hypothetical protein